MDSFKEKVLKIVSDIPRGSVMSYGEVAKMAKSPKAYRAVASIMSKNFDKKIPCHRVICTNGDLGGYNRGGEEAKKRLLIKEGYIN